MGWHVLPSPKKRSNLVPSNQLPGRILLNRDPLYTPEMQMHDPRRDGISITPYTLASYVRYHEPHADLPSAMLKITSPHRYAAYLTPGPQNSSPTIILVATFILTSSCVNSLNAYGIVILTTLGLTASSPAVLHRQQTPFQPMKPQPSQIST
jgi:hypothetical protein